MVACLNDDVAQLEFSAAAGAGRLFRFPELEPSRRIKDLLPASSFRGTAYHALETG